MIILIYVLGFLIWFNAAAKCIMIYTADRNRDILVYNSFTLILNCLEGKMSIGSLIGIIDGLLLKVLLANKY